MKRLINFITIATIFISTSVIAGTNGTTNVVPIIKQHHTTLMISGENSISTTVFSNKTENGPVVSAKVTSVRNGTDFQDFFETSILCEWADNPDNWEWVFIDLIQEFPDAPNQDSASVSVYSHNCTYDWIYYWGQQMPDRYNIITYLDAPLARASKDVAQIDTTYYLVTEINLPDDYQDEFNIQYRYQWNISYAPINLIPDDGEGDVVDQLGYPVYVETWDLRPNLHPYQITIVNDNGPIAADNPPIMDSTLYAIAHTEENAGFWAGITDVQFYLDDATTNFYETTTAELDSGGTSIDTSANFTFNSVGMHSVKVVVNQDSTINEADSTDNEMIIYFNVVSMSDTPAVAINPIQYTDWHDVSVTWFGSNLANDTLEYHYKLDGDAWTAWDTLTSVSYTDLTSGEHNFYVEVRSLNGLTDADSTMFVIDQPVELIDYSNVIITYGETLEFDLVVTGGSGTYNYSAVYGAVDTSGHYSWTPAYNSDPYNEVITASCQTWPNNTDSDGFSVEVTLSDVVIAGLDSNYVVLEEDILSDSEITATGGDNSSYSWTLTANTAGDDWLALTSSSGALTGFTGTTPSLDDAIVYDYTLSCVSQTQAASLDFTVTAWPFVSFAVDSTYNFPHNGDSQIQLSANGGDGSDYTWTVSDDTLLTIDSTQGNQVWLSANTNNMGTFQVDVSCSQSGMPTNNHTEQINFTVEQGLWAVEPMAILFPTVQTTQTMVVRNISGSESMTYALTLDSWSSYDILSELSGTLSAGESDTVQIVSHENNTPYERVAQLSISINDGAYVPVVDLTIAASSTSLQAFSFNGGPSASQELTIWNNTDSEQTVALSNGNDVFTLSETEAVLTPGAFTIMQIDAANVDEVAHDTLYVLSQDIDTRVLLRKQKTPEDNIVHDDGLPQGTVGHNDAIVNSFTIVDNDNLIGIEVFLRQNNQVFTWVVLDSDFNELVSGEYTNSYIGWQQINLTVENQQSNGTYYAGVKASAMSLEENVYVGYDDGSEYMTYWYNNDSFELLPGTAFIRALTTGVVGIDDEEIIPKRFSLNQNYPNPFNPSTTITYSLAVETDVRLTIYSLTGQVVATPVNSRQSLGNYTVNINMGNYGLSSGVYFYRLITPEFQAVKKLMFIK